MPKFFKVPLKWFFFTVATVIFIIVLQQYDVYISERILLEIASHRLEHQLRKVQLAAHDPTKLERIMKEADERISRLRRQLPPTLGIEKFIGGFEAQAVEMGIKVYDTRVRISAHEYYKKAMLNVGLEGEERDIN
jgi:Tfp pilus assembly protein PilO